MDENGRYHFQGAHSQSEYVIDGQTIADQTGVTFSNSIDPGIAQSIEVIYGNVPAEFGEKVGAVINMTTKSGLGAPFKGDVIGSFATLRHVPGRGLDGRRHAKFRRLRLLQRGRVRPLHRPPNPDNLQQRRQHRSAVHPPRFGVARLRQRLSALGAARPDGPRRARTRYTQEATGQAQRVETHDQNYNFGWQNVLSASTVLDVTAYARWPGSRSIRRRATRPITADSNRSLNNFGITPSFTWTTGIHEIKAGGVYKAYPIQELFRFGITDPTFNDPSSPDYNPNIAPYDLTRGGTDFDFSDSQHRTSTTRPTCRTRSAGRT